jgi:hypothetical protein
MKYILNFFILFFLFACAEEKTKDKPRIKIDARVDREFETTLPYRDAEKHKAFSIKLSIKNKSIKPVSFWLMTCSWEDDFIINNDQFIFFGRECDNNSPWITHLNPNESKELNTTIIKIEGTRYPNVMATKFGLIFIDTLRCRNFFDYNSIIGDKSKFDTIIWSNALYLNK